MKDAYYELITAIVQQAEADYLNDERKEDAVAFLKGEWFVFLTGIDGNIILTRLEQGRITSPFKTPFRSRNEGQRKPRNPDKGDLGDI